jgi:hypothetical protein
MTEKRSQRELLWFQTGGAFNFITAAPHCGELPISNVCTHLKNHHSTRIVLLSWPQRNGRAFKDREQLKKLADDTFIHLRSSLKQTPC